METVLFWILTAVGFGLAWYFWVSPRQPRASLGYVITQDRPLLEPGHLEQLQLISYDVPVEEPWVIGGAFINDGKSPIRPGDIDGRLRFVLRHGEDFLQMTVVGEGGLSYVGLSGADEEELLVTFEPSLLNPGDKLEFVGLTDGRPEFDRVEGHVAGVKEIREVTRGPMEWVEPTWFVNRPFVISTRPVWLYILVAAAIGGAVSVITGFVFELP